MTTCKECKKMYPHSSHYGICANNFGKCVDCMIEAKEFTESHLAQIAFMSGDNEPEEIIN